MFDILFFLAFGTLGGYLGFSLAEYLTLLSLALAIIVACVLLYFVRPKAEHQGLESIFTIPASLFCIGFVGGLLYGTYLENQIFQSSVNLIGSYFIK